MESFLEYIWIGAIFVIAMFFIFMVSVMCHLHAMGLLPLEESILESLPVMVFKPEDFKDGLECAVCLCDVVEGEKVRVLPKCNHGFHLDCIDMWFESRSTCPLCRNVVSNESSQPNSISNAEEINLLASSQGENLSPLNGLGFTNVLVLGNYETQTQGSSFDEGSSQQQQQPYLTSSSSSSLASDNTMLVIDIPR
ncbi:hypothetical protein KIW84_045628 [Lathyrus oleraceus]|uniref:RING-type E3 ubiquitin transferase n=1 Tax=Pisum sativum TaxID=3888 RepID=A0A9D4XL51_PEA|nr:hypothetical protein KIW84_045628 [Pisum sativum]